MCLVFVLLILGVIAGASALTLVVAARADSFSTATYASATLLSSGGFSVTALRGYLRAMPPIYEPIPTGEGP
ncbi:MAG TPA: hypothetical protein VFU16_00785 [Solirubrobacterales bacterium]|nr:hypothetical protein [Solirubrobacterales bacterium]